jgi:hypothetical protein
MIHRREQSVSESRLVCATWGLLDGPPIVAFDASRRKILDWAVARSPEAFPIGAADGAPFELPLGNGEAIAGEDCWAFRFDTADGFFRDQTGLERRWRTEVVLFRSSVIEKTHFSMRLTVVTAEPGHSFFRSAPALRSILSESPGLSCDGFFAAVPQVLDDAALLAEFLSRKDRLPAVVVSRDDSGATAVDADQLARVLAGFAHVFDLSSATSWGLSRVLGKRFSVFGGAIRLYWPGVDHLSQDSRVHPLWMKRAVEEFGGGTQVFRKQLLERLLAYSASRQDLDDLAPTFSAVKNYLGSKRIEAVSRAVKAAKDQVSLAKSDKEKIAALETEIDALAAERESLMSQVASLQDAVNETSQLRDLAYEDNNLLRESVDRMKAQSFALSARIRTLEARVSSPEGEPFGPTVIPDSFEDLQEWAENEFPDRLVILPKAERAAKKAKYSDVSHIYKCLTLLATHYVDMRRGVDGASERYEKEALGLRVDVSSSGDAVSDRRYRDQFRAQYTDGQIELDLHLAPAKGTSERGSHDPRKTYRIYFAWDDELQVVVVGSLPDHLTTSLTH